jgi:LysR family transcriptional regulator for metE and metH
MRLTLDTRHLALVVAIDECGSLHAAARRLHLTPSALSQQLRELEQRLGGPLYHRAWRRLVMTAAGRRLLDVARPVLAELASAETDVRGLFADTRGTVRLAAPCHLSYRWLPVLLKALADVAGGVQLCVVPEAAADPCGWLVERRLDVALLYDGTTRDVRVRTSPLYRDEIVAVVARSHPWAHQPWIELDAFRDEHLWGHPGLLARGAPLGRALRRAGVTPRQTTALPLAAVPLEMASAELGVAVVGRWAATEALADGAVQTVRIGARGLWLSWLVATRAESPEPALASFLDLLRAHHPGRHQIDARSA